MTHPLNDFILQFFAHGRKIGIVAGYSDQQVAIVSGMFLGFAQHFRIEYIDLQGAAAVFAVAPQKGLKFIFMLEISDHRWTKRDGVTGTVGKAVEVFPPIADAIIFLVIK